MAFFQTFYECFITKWYYNAPKTLVFLVKYFNDSKKMMLDTIRLIPLTRYNWENYLGVEISAEQQRFIPSILYSLAQSRFENLHPYGIEYEGVEIGFLMYGDFHGVCWLNRIMIDYRYQQRGLGKRAVQLFIEQHRSNPRFQEIRTSYAKNNVEAALLFDSLGFEVINESLKEECVAVLSINR